MLPPGSIIVFDLHLQNLRLPLPPFFHYFLAIHHIHLLQLTRNSIRVMSGFILVNLIKDLGLTLEDFHICYVRVRSGKNPKYFLSPRKGWVCFFGTSSKDYDLKQYFLLNGNWQSPLVNTSLFPMRRGFNFGKWSLIFPNAFLLIPTFSLILEIFSAGRTPTSTTQKPQGCLKKWWTIFRE